MCVNLAPRRSSSVPQISSVSEADTFRRSSSVPSQMTGLMGNVVPNDDRDPELESLRVEADQETPPTVSIPPLRRSGRVSSRPDRFSPY